MASRPCYGFDLATDVVLGMAGLVVFLIRYWYEP